MKSESEALRRCKFNLWDELNDDKKINHNHPNFSFFEQRYENHQKSLSKYSNAKKNQTHAKQQSGSIFEIIKSSLVIGQELCLCTLLFCFHRILIVHSFHDKNKGQRHNNEHRYHYESANITLLLIVIAMTLFCIIISSEEEEKENIGKVVVKNFIEKKYEKLKTRVTDAFLLAIVLRLCSSVLRTLTASYSSDTIFALCFFGIFIHMLTCDYDYANGFVTTRNNNDKTVHRSINTTRSTYLGGSTIISLNALLFTTVLLSSRLKSNIDTFIFVSSSIVAFGFYPSARHIIAKKKSSLCYFQISPTAIISILIYIAAMITLNMQERIIISNILLVIIIISPICKWILSKKKVCISGPWDIAHFESSSDE